MPLVCDGFRPLTVEALRTISTLWSSQQIQMLANYGISIEDVTLPAACLGHLGNRDFRGVFIWLFDPSEFIRMGRFTNHHQKHCMVRPVPIILPNLCLLLLRCSILWLATAGLTQPEGSSIHIYSHILFHIITKKVIPQYCNICQSSVGPVLDHCSPKGGAVSEPSWKPRSPEGDQSLHPAPRATFEAYENAQIWTCPGLSKSQLGTGMVQKVRRWGPGSSWNHKVSTREKVAVDILSRCAPRRVAWPEHV